MVIYVLEVSVCSGDVLQVSVCNGDALLKMECYMNTFWDAISDV